MVAEGVENATGWRVARVVLALGQISRGSIRDQALKNTRTWFIETFLAALLGRPEAREQEMLEGEHVARGTVQTHRS